jgi:hypothetical protein
VVNAAEPPISPSTSTLTWPSDNDPALRFVTAHGTPEWQKLASVKRYELGARHYVTTDSYTPGKVERLAVLDFADLGLRAADASFAAADLALGNELVNAAMHAIDLAFTKVIDNTMASKGASFVMGVLEGATGGLLDATPIRGHERVYAIGQALGAISGAVVDVAQILTGFETALGSTALAVAAATPTGGASLVVGAGAAAAGVGLVAAGVASASLHYNQFAQAVEELQQPSSLPSDKIPSSKKLAKSMEAAGQVRPPDSAAHHIVAGNAPGASNARAVLKRFGVGINDPANGVFLPKNTTVTNPTGAAVHSTLQTVDYYVEVTKMLEKATTRAEAEEVLATIRDLLLLGELW